MIRTLGKALRRNAEGAVVLMYHRITAPGSDPWNLCVHPKNFEEQIRSLKESFQIIPMHHLAERLIRGADLSGLVAITFDDGYLDNFTEARPVLERYNVPATFFFTTLFQHPGRKFWWDELEQLILHTPVLPDTVNLPIRKRTISLILGQASALNEEIADQNRTWRHGEPFSNSRIKLFFELWSELKEMTIANRDQTMQVIKNWAGLSLVPTPPLMNGEQVRELTDHGLFDAGAHSVNHPALGTLPAMDQKKEIEISRTELENIVSDPLSGFAYPYGHYNEKTPVLVKNAGFRYALTTEERRVANRDSAFCIPRCAVPNMTGPELVKRVTCWQAAKV